MTGSGKQPRTQRIFLPWSQCFPVNQFPTQVHVKPPLVLVHFAPFLQGFLMAHSSTSGKQNDV